MERLQTAIDGVNFEQKPTNNVFIIILSVSERFHWNIGWPKRAKICLVKWLLIRVSYNCSTFPRNNIKLIFICHRWYLLERTLELNASIYHPSSLEQRAELTNQKMNCLLPICIMRHVISSTQCNKELTTNQTMKYNANGWLAVAVANHPECVGRYLNCMWSCNVPQIPISSCEMNFAN